MSPQMNRREFAKLMAALSVTPLVSAPPNTPRGGQRMQRTEAPNILFLVFDTLAAPHMSLYGYQRETTPNLARFAERANVYHSHRAGGNFTTAGTASLLTGSNVWSHRAFNHTGLVTERYIPRNLFQALDGAGYHRVAYSHNHLAYLLLYQFREGIDELLSPRAFSLYDGQVADPLFKNDTDLAYRSIEELILRRGDVPGSLFLSLLDRVRLRALKRQATRDYRNLFPKGTPELFKMSFVLEEVIDGLTHYMQSLPQPFLAYFHVLPPHEPYLPRKEFIDIFHDGWRPDAKAANFFPAGQPQRALNRFRREYDEYLAYTDAEFGRWIDLLERSGFLDNSYVIFTSDHGQLFERAVHGHVTPLLYEGLLHVPLLIRRPGQQQRQDVYQPTSCADLLPTLCHLAGQPVPDWCEGRLLPAIDAAAEGGERAIYAVEAKSNAREAALTQASVAMYKGPYKLIQYRGYQTVPEGYELFDLYNDPEEQEDLAAMRPSLLGEMREELLESLAAADAPYTQV